MGRLTDGEKRDLLADARLKSRRRDFDRLARLKVKGFSLKLLEELTDLIKIDYQQKRIEAKRNKL
ncbi:MAG: hypothetical protein ABIL39_03220 [candidate division WOR-3 bacterium]